MRLGLYGGSFDPIHQGHLAPVREAQQTFALGQVIYLPTAQPPHKRGQQLAPAWMRYTMVELALIEDANLIVSPFEMNLDRPAYTVETLAHFRKVRPRDELFLLIGSDSLASLNRWRDWRRIIQLARLLVLTRPKHEPEAVRASLDPELQALCVADDKRGKVDDRRRIHLLANKPLAVSSTAIRQRIATGDRPETGWLPPMVLDYVDKYELYRKSDHYRDSER